MLTNWVTNDSFVIDKTVKPVNTAKASLSKGGLIGSHVSVHLFTAEKSDRREPKQIINRREQSNGYSRRQLSFYNNSILFEKHGKQYNENRKVRSYY